MREVATRPVGLLAKRQPLGLLPTGWFWTDDVVHHVRWLVFPSAFMAGAAVALAGGGWLSQFAAAAVAGQLVLGGLERLIRRELRRRRHETPPALAPSSSD